MTAKKKANTASSTRAARTPKPKSIRDLKRRKVKASELIKIPVEQDEVSYILYACNLSLGAADSFSRLSQMDPDDPKRGARGLSACRRFLTTHLRDEDGSELEASEIEDIIDSLDMEFAAELAHSMIEFIMGGSGGEDDSGKVLSVEGDVTE